MLLLVTTSTGTQTLPCLRTISSCKLTQYSKPQRRLLE
jgi:hypothetical protein